MRLARQGDDDAYRRLLSQVAIWLRAGARRGLASAGPSPAESQDIVQQALLAVHLKREIWDAAGPAVAARDRPPQAGRPATPPSTPSRYRRVQKRAKSV
jgi:hypothetical protein